MSEAFDFLDGLTVIEFGDHLAGSVCTYHLAMLGARVLLLEPEEGCWLRRASASPLFTAFGRGKHSISLTTAIEEDLDRLGNVCLVVEPARGALARKGLPAGWRLGSSEGPLALDFREADGTILTETAAQAAFGMSAYLGSQDRAPYRIGFELISYSAGVLAAQAVLAALPLKIRRGLGQRIRVPFSRVAANILNNVVTSSVEPDQDVGFSRSWAATPYTGLPVADGEVDFLFYGPRSEEEWRSFCAKVGRPELGADPRFSTNFARTYRSGELVEALGPSTARYKREDLLRLLRESGAMAVPRVDVGEAAQSEQAKANRMVVPVHPDRGAVLVASPWEIDGRRAVVGADADGGARERPFPSSGEMSHATA